MQLDRTTLAIPRRLAGGGAAELRDRLRAAGRRLVRGRTDGAAWVRPALLVLLVGTALLYLWNLADSGWANAYYTASVQAGAKDWQAMLFGSFDPANAITVDKTPAALWVMSLSARIFGFNMWSVLAPQALMGVASVWLLYLTVRRTFGPLAGLVAGAALALTPVAALMFRFNNPDALLTMLLVAAAYATVRAIGRASTRWILLAGALVGFAFLAKMLQAFLVIPALAGVYLLAAPTTLPWRLLQVAGAGLAVVVSGGWYLALVALWPAASRPYIGGSQTNSLLDLIIGYNGFGRITGQEVGRVGGGGPSFSADAGILRLFLGELGSQVAWLLPAALLALVAILWLRRDMPRTDPQRAQVLMWGGWLVVTALVFSLMEGIFHAYYTVALAPAIGALVGIGAAVGWRHRRLLRARIVLAAGLVLTAGWALVLLGRSPNWNAWLVPVIGFGTVAAAAGLVLLAGTRGTRVARLAVGAASLGLMLLAPGLASLATAAQPHTGAIPSAEPPVTAAGALSFGNLGAPHGSGGRGGPAGGPGTPFGRPPIGLPGRRGGMVLPPSRGTGGPAGTGPFGHGLLGGLAGLLDARKANPQLVAALQAGASGYRWVAATTGSNNAAGLALSTGQSVMAIGGFNGSDPSPTLAQVQQWVAERAIHYYVSGGDALGFAGTSGGSNVAARIADWVDSHYTATRIGGVTVYDLTGD